MDGPDIDDIIGDLPLPDAADVSGMSVQDAVQVYLTKNFVLEYVMSDIVDISYRISYMISHYTTISDGYM